MKATEFLDKLSREVLDLEECGTFNTNESPWDDLIRIFPYDSANGNPIANTMYFYRWGGNKIDIWGFLPKPDMTLFIDDCDEEIYLWQIE